MKEVPSAQKEGCREGEKSETPGAFSTVCAWIPTFAAMTCGMFRGT
jgi:hypothetical protein